MELLDDWASLLLRWGHVVAGITWVGTSFYFNWFDLSVRPSGDSAKKENVRGTLTEVHGGSYYYHEQFWPDRDPPRLLHHSGPAQLTFVTGILLFALIYWLGASTYLVDPRVLDISSWLAVAISAASLVLGWLLYHHLCLSVKDDRVVLLVVVLAVATAGLGYLQIFSSRAAFLHMGVLMGTIMAMNVVFVIVPCHIGMRQQIQKGETLDLSLGEKAKRRSQHNNYFTLPVVLSMIGIHFPAGFGHPLAWAILPLVMLAGVVFRHYRNIQMAEEANRWEFLIGGIALVAAAAGLSLIDLRSTGDQTAAKVLTEADALAIVRTHCASCHAERPTDENFDSPPAGLILESLEDVRRNNDRVYQQTIVDQIMPLGNATGMTDEERNAFGLWLKSGP